MYLECLNTKLTLKNNVNLYFFKKPKKFFIGSNKKYNLLKEFNY